MKFEYSYEMVNGHIILENGPNHLLIDTGAPTSVGNTSRLDFAGKSHMVLEEYMGVTPDSLSGSVGTTLSGLVGVDILSPFDILIDPSVCRIVMSEEELSIDGNSLSVDAFMGIPIIDAVVSDVTVRMFFDTGAKHSYLKPELIKIFPTTGVENDFYPGLGEFSTQIFSVPIRIGSKETTLQMGILPKLLQATLMMANTDGILGTALLDVFTILFAPRLKRISLLERNS